MTANSIGRWPASPPGERGNVLSNEPGVRPSLGSRPRFGNAPATIPLWLRGWWRLVLPRRTEGGLLRPRGKIPGSSTMSNHHQVSLAERGGIPIRSDTGKWPRESTPRRNRGAWWAKGKSVIRHQIGSVLPPRQWRYRTRITRRAWRALCPLFLDMVCGRFFC